MVAYSRLEAVPDLQKLVGGQQAPHRAQYKDGPRPVRLWDVLQEFFQLLHASGPDKEV